jgi:hypothetical protein
MNFSDYVVYVDESGDHDLVNVYKDYPAFVLAFCIFEKDSYINDLVPAFQRLKFRWFGHDCVVFHEREIRKQQKPFVFLQSLPKRDAFMAELTALIAAANFTLIAAVIDKHALKSRYPDPGNPYKIALQFCVERLHHFLRGRGQADRLTHCIFERRGKHEDAAIELEFRRICDGANYEARRIDCLDILLLEKASNSCGLQVSDLVARPIGLKYLRPSQENRAYEVINGKFRRSSTGGAKGYGLKTFP